MLTKFSTKLGASITTGAVLIASFAAPVFADQNVLENGNGANSTNNVNLNQNSSSSVVQQNAATVVNSVSTNSSTGGNSQNDNTGGDNTTVTGNSTTNTQIMNAVNQNQAQIANCGACSGQGSSNVAVTGNGADSENNVNNNHNMSAELFQNNQADVTNAVSTNADTGGNAQNADTGGNNTTVTGNITSNTDIQTQANKNVASLGGVGAGAGAGSTNLLIAGNGFDSGNNVNLNQDQSASIVQANDAYVTNAVENNSQTGDNSQNADTGGNNAISTGWVKANTFMSTAVNQNLAAIGCSCVTGDLSAKEGQNGSQSENNLNVNANNNVTLFQGGEGNGNDAVVVNSAANNAATGTNDQSADTGSGALMDPNATYTGNVSSSNDVQTSANSNAFFDGSSLGFTWNMGSLSWPF